MGDLTLTSLANDIFVAADTVGREAVGYIPAVTMNADSTRAAVGDNVTAAFTAEAGALQDIGTGAMSVPEGVATSITGETLSLSNAKAVQIPLGAEQEKLLRNTGKYDSVYGDLVAQAMRKLTNQMEADLALAAKNNARTAAGGTAGTAAFGSTLDLLATARQQLVDAGAPQFDGELQCVMNTAAGVNVRTNAAMFNANQSGSVEVREQGILINAHGINLRETGQAASHTAGTMTGHDPDGALSAGDTSFAFAGSDSGTLLEGDVIQFGGAGKKYIVANGTTGSGAATGTIQLNGSGIIDAVSAGAEITMAANYTANSVFHRNAIELAMRAPAVPSVGDAADDSLIVQDPHSGMVFEVRIYKGYRRTLLEVGAVWGVKVWKPDFVTTILG